MINSNTDNSRSSPIGDRYRKWYEDQPEVARKSPHTNNNSTIADHTTSTSVAGAGANSTDHTPLDGTLLTSSSGGGGGNNATATTTGTGNDPNKNHSLYELNRKYIEQKTKINNERNKFISSYNEKRQQQLQELQGQSGGRTAGKTQPEATQEETTVGEPAEVKLIISSSTAAPPPATVDANNSATTPVTTSPSSNKLSPGNIFKNFFK